VGYVKPGFRTSKSSEHRTHNLFKYILWPYYI